MYRSEKVEMEQDLRELQKQEAIERLKILNLHPNVLSEFKADGTIYYSERINEQMRGILYWLSNNDEYVKKSCYTRKKLCSI